MWENLVSLWRDFMRTGRVGCKFEDLRFQFSLALCFVTFFIISWFIVVVFNFEFSIWV
jgi:hypothetical protein